MPAASGADREFFLPHALSVAPLLLGARVTVSSPEGDVTVRISEVEAYHGVGVPGAYDPGSHSKDRKTNRNASMFGPPGHAYVYFTYGLHYALNFVCSPTGVASGVLLRSGTVLEGHESVRVRRRAKRNGTQHEIADNALARGPGNLATALGLSRDSHDGLDLLAHPFRVEIDAQQHFESGSSPRVGVAGVAGGPAFPWRFFITREPSVSAFRAGRGSG